MAYNTQTLQAALKEAKGNLNQRSPFKIFSSYRGCVLLPRGRRELRYTFWNLRAQKCKWPRNIRVKN